MVGGKDKLDSERESFWVGRGGSRQVGRGVGRSGREVVGRKKYWVGKELERGAEKW